MQILFLGLGKMGQNIALKLQSKGHQIWCWNRNDERRQEARELGLNVSETLEEIFLKNNEDSKIVWLMVSSEAVDELLEKIRPFIKADDIVIDGGNSFYKKTLERSQKLISQNINYLDAGISGGPYAEKKKGGWCVMVGGQDEIVKKVENIFQDIACSNGYLHVGENGSGHFTKMIHNAIEYGMMQSVAEGFELLKKEKLTSESVVQIADLYNQGSVIESRLIGWLSEAYQKHGADLENFDSTVAQNGEGRWALEYAQENNVETPAIQVSVEFREKSSQKETYAGKVLSALRFFFGGHDTLNKK